MRVRLKSDVTVKHYTQDGPPEGEKQFFAKGSVGTVTGVYRWYGSFDNKERVAYHIKLDLYQKSPTLSCDDRLIEFIDKSANDKSFKINKKRRRYDYLCKHT